MYISGANGGPIFIEIEVLMGQGLNRHQCITYFLGVSLIPVFGKENIVRKLVECFLSPMTPTRFKQEMINTFSI